jgi:Xaa-Pro aminopeptidase
MKTIENLLMVADSEHDANMLYAVGMFVPDPFIYLRIRGRQYIVMSDLEIDRARREAPQCHVLSLGRYQEKLRKDGIKRPALPQSLI